MVLLIGKSGVDWPVENVAVGRGGTTGNRIKGGGGAISRVHRDSELFLTDWRRQAAYRESLAG